MGYFKQTYLRQVAAPAQEPVSLEEAKTHLRVSHNLDDTYIQGLITLARQEYERITGRALITQTWKLGLDWFPGIIYLPKYPVQSITSIVVAGTTWDAANYEVDLISIPPRIVPVSTWPTVPVDNELSPIEVTFIAGEGDAPGDIPDSSPLHAIKLLISHWYENRAPYAQGATTVVEIPEAAKVLMTRARQW